MTYRECHEASSSLRLLTIRPCIYPTKLNASSTLISRGLSMELARWFQTWRIKGDFLVGFSSTLPTHSGARVYVCIFYFLLAARGKKCIRRSKTATYDARAVIKKFDHLKTLSIILPTHRKKSVLRGDRTRNPRCGLTRR
ncbi:hypothetical protein EVAR_9293_1 [Eumeta japonica]|uniref:Uncharacterized protein n=1 Tax=Eumeta variegata TaxID=151549 RepID=A0A4C1TN08_EUMVA|nr:hypothetical protein EVAR_9293_1 [Eumeta japonica]